MNLHNGSIIQSKNNLSCNTCKLISIKFEDKHNLLPSLFPNGSVCGHLHEIRSINFNKQKCILNNKKININPINLKIKNLYNK